MIDGFYKKHIDPFWDKAASPLARHFSANQVTILGLLLVAGACGAFLLHRSPMLLGISLALAFAADSLDGAVARLRRETSYFGGYLDAIIDRYQEGVVFFTLAFAGSSWAAAFLAFSGAMLTSYAKARVAIEIPVENNGWPDLFERQERLIYLCAVLIFGPAVASWLGTTDASVIATGLWGLAALCHATAIQRILRARALLVSADAAQKAKTGYGQ